MNDELIIVLTLLAAAVIMFALNKPRMDAVALIMICLLPLTGVITMHDALSGFSDPAVILIALLFVIGECLTRTGIVQRLGDWLIQHAATSEKQLVILLMLTVAAIGAFMSSTGVVAIFIPVVLRIAKRTNYNISHLMMPLAYAALLSGMLTLVATPPNLIVHSELIRNGLPGFSFFSFTTLGVPLLVLAIIYMLVIRRFISNKTNETTQHNRPHIADWVKEYHLERHEARIRILKDSPLENKSLCDLDLRQTSGINILAIERPSPLTRKLLTPRPNTTLKVGDILLLDIINMPEAETISNLCKTYKLKQLPLSGRYLSDISQHIGIAQAMIPAASPLIGHSPLEIRFRNRYDLTVIGLKRGEHAVVERLADYKFAMGDTILLIGPWRAIRRQTISMQELIMLDMPEEIDDAVIAPSRAPYAIIGLLLMVALMISGTVSNVMAALIACLFFGATRCIHLDAAYRSIHWQSLILIIGMMPFSIALQKTGGIELASNLVLSVAGQSSPHIVLIALFIVTAVLGLFISNTATAVLMAPVALSIAHNLGASPYPFAMTVALAASAAFMTPVSSPVNALVMGPGRYRFIDFIKFGVPFTIITMIVCIILIPLWFPF